MCKKGEAKGSETKTEKWSWGVRQGQRGLGPSGGEARGQEAGRLAAGRAPS